MARKANGAAIRAIRIAYGIPQRHLAERVGIRPSTMSLIESGRRYGTPEKLRRIADELGVPLDAITTTVPEPDQAA